jgi:N-acetylmuramoyl-L-alanine amidase
MKQVIIIIKKSRFIIAVLLLSPMLVLAAALAIVNTPAPVKALEGRVVVVDAGHGGVDGGANNRSILEKDVNLDIALKLRAKLEQNGARVIMTRTEDVDLSDSERIDRNRYLEDLNTRLGIINNIDAEFFVSIHTNSNRNNPSARGMMTFYYDSHPHNSSIAAIFQNIFNTESFSYEGRTHMSRHMPQKGKYFILVNAVTPGLIVETGFITNSTDLMLLKKQEYREYAAGLIYKGIAEYFLRRESIPRKSNL